MLTILRAWVLSVFTCIGVIAVCDGAELFFGAEFEVAAGRVENVYFNGNLGASSDQRIEPTLLSRRDAARCRPDELRHRAAPCVPIAATSYAIGGSPCSTSGGTGTRC